MSCTESNFKKNLLSINKTSKIHNKRLNKVVIPGVRISPLTVKSTPCINISPKVRFYGDSESLRWSSDRLRTINLNQVQDINANVTRLQTEKQAIINLTPKSNLSKENLNQGCFAFIHSDSSEKSDALSEKDYEYQQLRTKYIQRMQSSNLESTTAKNKPDMRLLGSIDLENSLPQVKFDIKKFINRLEKQLDDVLVAMPMEKFSTGLNIERSNLKHEEFSHNIDNVPVRATEADQKLLDLSDIGKQMDELIFLTSNLLQRNQRAQIPPNDSNLMCSATAAVKDDVVKPAENERNISTLNQHENILHQDSLYSDQSLVQEKNGDLIIIDKNPDNNVLPKAGTSHSEYNESYSSVMVRHENHSSDLNEGEEFTSKSGLNHQNDDFSESAVTESNSIKYPIETESVSAERSSLLSNSANERKANTGEGRETDSLVNKNVEKRSKIDIGDDKAPYLIDDSKTGSTNENSEPVQYESHFDIDSPVISQEEFSEEKSHNEQKIIDSEKSDECSIQISPSENAAFVDRSIQADISDVSSIPLSNFNIIEEIPDAIDISCGKDTFPINENLEAHKNANVSVINASETFSTGEICLPSFEICDLTLSEGEIGFEASISDIQPGNHIAIKFSTKDLGVFNQFQNTGSHTNEIENVDVVPVYFDNKETQTTNCDFQVNDCSAMNSTSEGQLPDDISLYRPSEEEIDNLRSENDYLRKRLSSIPSHFLSPRK